MICSGGTKQFLRQNEALLNEGLDQGRGAGLVKHTEEHWRKAFQRQFDHALWKFDAGDLDAETDAESLGRIAGDEVKTAQLQAGHPLDLPTAKLVEKSAADGVAAG